MINACTFANNLYKDVEYLRNNMSFFLEANILKEKEQDIKFCKCQFLSLMQNNNDNPAY